MSVPSVSVTELLRIDPTSETQNISSAIREIVLTRFRRKGAIVAVSGGIDSSVVAALCVEALGPENVIALFLPEADSSSGWVQRPYCETWRHLSSWRGLDKPLGHL